MRSLQLEDTRPRIKKEISLLAALAGAPSKMMFDTNTVTPDATTTDTRVSGVEASLSCLLEVVRESKNVQYDISSDKCSTEPDSCDIDFCPTLPPCDIAECIYNITGAFCRLHTAIDEIPVYDTESCRSPADVVPEGDLWLDDFRLADCIDTLSRTRFLWECCLVNIEHRSTHWNDDDNDDIVYDIEEVLADAQCIARCYDTHGMDPLQLWLSHYVLLHFDDTIRSRWEDLCSDHG